MWSRKKMEADAAAAFALSSPDASDFGASPSGRALRKARDDYVNDFFEAFQGSSLEASPLPYKNDPGIVSTTHLGQPSMCASDTNSHKNDHHRHKEDGGPSSTEEMVLQKIAQSLEEEVSEGSQESSVDSDDSASICSSDGSTGVYMPPSPIFSRGRAIEATASGHLPTTSSSCGGLGAPVIRSNSWASQNSAAASSTSASNFTLRHALEAASAYKGVLKGSLRKQRETHYSIASIGFGGFTCSPRCTLKGSDDSCLDSGFDRPAFRAFHVHTYGRAALLHELHEVKAAIHAAVWELRTPLPPPHRDNRLFTVSTWRLGGASGKIVCKKAFIAAMGGSSNAHREALTLTIAGKAPSDKNAYKAASSIVKNLHHSDSKRASWAQSWWKRHLMVHDWLPNEIAIQYRGPTWICVHSDFYAPEAKRANMLLKPKQWMRHRKPAVKKLHNEFFPNVTTKQLSVVRSARHSKFPECTDCQNLRREYKKDQMDPRASEAKRAESYKRMVDHATMWQAELLEQ